MFRASDIFGGKGGPKGGARPPPAAIGSSSWSNYGQSAPGGSAKSASLAGPPSGNSGYSGGKGGGKSSWESWGAASTGNKYSPPNTGYTPYGGGQNQKGSWNQGNNSWKSNNQGNTSWKKENTWTPAPGPKLKAPPGPMAQPGPNTIQVVGDRNFPQGIEKDIEAAARELSIQHCISCCEDVRYVSPSLAFIDFPFHEACRDFLDKSGGQISVRGRMYKCWLSNSRNSYHQQKSMADDEFVAADGTVLDHPTDTLMIRQIGDFGERVLREAAMAVVPMVKNVRIQRTRTGNTQGFGFVHFHSVCDAQTALSRLQANGSTIQGRRVAITFAKPQTHEEMLQSEVSYKNEQKQIENQSKAALSGINSDMWSSYLNFCKDESEKLAEAKAKARQAAAEAQARIEAEQAAMAPAPDAPILAPDGSAAVPDPVAPPPMASGDGAGDLGAAMSGLQSLQSGTLPAPPVPAWGNNGDTGSWGKGSWDNGPDSGPGLPLPPMPGGLPDLPDGSSGLPPFPAMPGAGGGPGGMPGPPMGAMAFTGSLMR